MKKLIYTFLLLLGLSSPALAQNPTCPTRPFGDNSNACASTAFVQNAFTSCTALGSFLVGTGSGSVCSTTAAPLTAILNGTLNLFPLAGSLQQGLHILTSGPSSGPLTAGAKYSNYIEGSFNTALNGTGGGGTTICACWSLLQVSASIGATFNGIEAYGISVGMVVNAANASVSDLVALSTGASTDFAYGGNLYGGTMATSVGASGSVRVAVGLELGVGVFTNTGVPIRYGLNVDNYGQYTATGMDTAISIQGGFPGGSWKYAINLTNPGGALAPALAVSGTIIAAEVAMTLVNGFDFSNITFSSYVLNAKHALLTGSGTMALGDSTVAGSYSLNGPASTAVFNVVQQNSVSKWTEGVTTIADWALFNVSLSQNGFKIAFATNIPSFPALSVAGAVCNNASGDLSTSATGCTGLVQSVATGGTGRSTLTANAFLTGNGTSPINMVAITGLVLGNGASAPTAYAGTSCTNQFPRSLSAAGVATCASVSLTADITGTLGVANGGTGQVTLTANAFLTGNTTSGINQVALTGLVLGNGASAPTAYAGTSCTSPQSVVSISAAGVATCTTLALPTTQTFTSGSGTYTRPANTQWIRVRMVGGGSGGGGGNQASLSTAGGNSTFSTFTANGGAGSSNAIAGAGGTVTGCTSNISGGQGSAGGQSVISVIGADGGQGASSFYGGGGLSGYSTVTNPGAAQTNTGSGGGGGGANGVSNGVGGYGGAAGGYCESIITSPASTYSYGIGAGGAGGSAGTNGTAGAAGAAGYIVVEEFYAP